MRHHLFFLLLALLLASVQARWMTPPPEGIEKWRQQVHPGMSAREVGYTLGLPDLVQETLSGETVSLYLEGDRALKVTFEQGRVIGLEEVDLPPSVVE